MYEDKPIQYIHTRTESGFGERLDVSIVSWAKMTLFLNLPVTKLPTPFFRNIISSSVNVNITCSFSANISIRYFFLQQKSREMIETFTLIMFVAKTVPKTVFLAHGREPIFPVASFLYN